MIKFIWPLAAVTLLNKIPRKPKDTLSIKGIIEVKHLIKNRMRVHIPLIKNNTSMITTLKSELSKVQVIHSIEASPITGTVLINFDQEQIEPVLLLGVIIKVLDLEKQISRDHDSELESEFSLITKSIDTSLMKVSKDKLDVKSSITVLIIAGLAYNLFVKRAPLTTLPSPITLLWWMYQNNLMEKKGK